MTISLFLKSRDNVFNAEAVYENGTVTVKKGSHVNTIFANHIRGGKKAKSYLEDRQYVDENGLVKKDCTFQSPSTAAQFVTGSSRNGYLVWKTKEGKKLQEVIKRI